MEYLKTEQQLNDKKTAKAIECIKKACEAVHVIKVARQKTEKARYALQSNEKLFVWNALQEYLSVYKGFINSVSNYTGFVVYSVCPNFFDNCTIFEIKWQLENVIAFVYLKEAVSSVAKDSFKQCLKKLLKSTGMFTETELAFI
ncbi:MAG: hypothetical protein IJX91_00250 [Clostridia bacterium]|nr:hypothetical protein [Clostridia bacterium]